MFRRVDGMCIGSPRLVGGRKTGNSNMQGFFCTMLYYSSHGKLGSPLNISSALSPQTTAKIENVAQENVEWGRQRHDSRMMR